VPLAWSGVPAGAKSLVLIGTYQKSWITIPVRADARRN
jgi:hypothetical protein